MVIMIAAFFLLFGILVLVRGLVSNYINKSYLTITILVVAAAVCILRAFASASDFNIFRLWVLFGISMLIVCIAILFNMRKYQRESLHKAHDVDVFENGIQEQ